MREITEKSEIMVGDSILLDSEQEGQILHKTIYGFLVEVHDGEGYQIKVKPNEIISLRRGKDFFKVSIK
jgi:hypothetical protein